MGLPRHPALRLAGHLCRIALALVFLLAGLLKALDPEGFGQEVAQYGLLGGTPARAFAYLLIPLEVAVGLALLLNFRTVVSLWVATGLMTLFIGAISYALVTDQPLQDCACFGRNAPRTPQQTLREDVGFLAAGLAGLFLLRGKAARAGARVGRPRWKGPMLAATALASGAFVIASPHLPIDDLATALRAGVRWEDLGVALAEVDLGQGAHFVALMGMRDEASAAAIQPLNALATAGRFSMMGLYADDDAAFNEFFWNRGPAFPLFHAAPADLRRLHRRLPRYLAVKDGTVTGTWDALPAAGEIQEALR